MKIINRNKGKDVKSMTPEQAEKLIIEAESNLTLLEKERDRKKAKYDELFKQGVEASDSRRMNIAHELEFIEKDISGIDKRMKSYRETIRILQEIKSAKSMKTELPDQLIDMMDPAEVKNLLIQSKSAEKLSQRKRESVLSSIDDVSGLDEEEKGEENKYMQIFREMDRSREDLSPNREKTSSKEKENDTDKEEE